MRRFRATMRGRPPSRGLRMLWRERCAWIGNAVGGQLLPCKARGVPSCLRVTKRRVAKDRFRHVEVVDLAAGIKRGQPLHLKPQASDGLMEQRLRAGQQTMLFINRRGCGGLCLLQSLRSCDKMSALRCIAKPACDKTASGRMVCHYCGYDGAGAGNMSGVRIEVHQRV